MTWLILRIASILWFIYSLLFFAFATSLKSENESIIHFKIALYIFLFFAAILIFFLYRQSVIDRKRKKFKKLRHSLNTYFRNMQFKISIFDFAEENSVTIHDVQKFIDYIIEFYNGKLDINEKGIIHYKPQYYTTSKNKLSKKKKRK